MSEDAFARLAARLLARARALAAELAQARQGDRHSIVSGRWRDARLLWPLFGKD